MGKIYKYLLISLFTLILISCSAEQTIKKENITNEKEALQETQKISDNIVNASETAEELETLSKDLEELLK